MDMTTQVKYQVEPAPATLTKEEWNTFYRKLYHFLRKEYLKDPFTVFVNTLASNFNQFGEKESGFIYVGLEEQRRLLEGNKYPVGALKPSWKVLGKEDFKVIDSVYVTYDLKETSDSSGNLNLAIDSMENYIDKAYTEEHIAELEIMRYCLDLEAKSYHYLSFALNHQCHFHSAVHIILSEKDLEKNFGNSDNLHQKPVNNLINTARSYLQEVIVKRTELKRIKQFEWR